MATATAPAARLLTVGHGTLEAPQLAALLRAASVRLVVDVRRFPASRRHPHFRREAMAAWLPEAGVDYRWEESLGGRRAAAPSSPNTGLRNAGFRGYADHMRTPAFRAALTRVLTEAAHRRTAVLCAESVWWRCHRRLVADAAALLHDAQVAHLHHDGRLHPHEPTDWVTREGDVLVYARRREPTLPEV
ncbi:MAG: DUF488 domain-containing protein [Actinomycetota bacterium]|nr:DUF488 domain-containing protein [Actinomycetota bacterium]